MSGGDDKMSRGDDKMSNNNKDNNKRDNTNKHIYIFILKKISKTYGIFMESVVK